MNQDVKKRLSGLENIFQNVHENMEVLEFLIVNLFPEKFNAQNNKFLMWLWRTTTSQQIIAFYHIMHKEQKHSFQKILNLLIQQKIKINYNELNRMLNELNEEYSLSQFETVRSKYLAHKDINVEQIKTEMQSVRKFTESLIEVQRFLLSELKLPLQIFNNEVKLSLWEIFGEINEYGNLLSYLNFESSNGKETFTMSDLIKFRTL